jgi:modulator of FtsH protease
MEAWHDFYVAQVGASAALAGLVFVGISINLSKILSFAALPNRALLAVVLLLVVLVQSSLQLAPAQDRSFLGSELLLLGLAAWAIVTALQRDIFGKLEKQYRRGYLPIVCAAQGATLSFVVAGLSVLLRGDGGMYWVIPGVIACYVVAVMEAWILLIEINR